MKNKTGGFLTLISILIVTAIIAIWFYSSSTKKIEKQEDVDLIQTGIPTITETRNDIQKAEEVKKLVESKYENLEDF